MAGDDTPGGIPTHRPLPSIDIPILRDDVARSRKGRLVWTGVLAVGGVLLLVVAMLIPATQPSEPEAEDDVPGAVPLSVGLVPPVDAGPPPVDAAIVLATPVTVETTPDRVRTVHHFGEAHGFRPALTSTGLSGADADALITALDGVMDFRRCRPDDEMAIERDTSGTMVRFEYRASITQIYEATRGDDGRLTGRQVEVPVDTQRLARGGSVTSSLGAALEAAGLGRTMVGTFVDVFDGRIDFNTETRSGDAFRILVDEESIDGTFLRYGTVWAVEYRSQRRGVLTAFYFTPRDAQGDFYDETGRGVHGGWLRTPLHYDHISSPFDMHRMHPVLHRVMPHNGIDFAAGTGTTVWAAADGEVTFAGVRGANGNLVGIRHSEGFETFYAHLSRFATGLHVGQTVHQRDVIGYVGSTGRSTGPHLHFGLKRHGAFVDPASELNGPGRMLPAAQLGRFRTEMARLREALAAIPLPEVHTAEAPEPSATASDEGAMD
jgi:murein DD-endopeptidase MepM/ murein hydrolase activator NlpD